jgi:hypothetical protein
VRRLAGISVAIAIALFAADRARAAEVVAVLAPHDSRLADEIRRELVSSKFEVLSADLAGRRWQDVAALVDGGRVLRGVAVEPNDRTLTVYTRPAGGSTVDIRLVLSVDPADRMARRHACLSVVEFLHALGEADQSVPSEGDQTSGARPVAAPPGTARGRARVAPPSPANAPGPVLAAPPPAAVTPSEHVGGGWQLGVATTIDFETGAGEPTSHLQFLARHPLSRHVLLCGRMLWPLLATQYRTGNADIRSWTFGAGAGLQYAFAPGARLRPYLGLALGARFGLAETTPLAAAQSDQSLNVSGTFGIEVGVRYAVRPLLEVFFQIEAARNWLIPPPRKDDTNGEEAANGEAARASIGITFES